MSGTARAQNQRRVGEDRNADGIGHVRHLFCSNQIADLIWGELLALCTGSSMEAQLSGRAMLIEYASDARCMSVALAEIS